MRRENKKVLLATGIFPPDVGGPGVYVNIVAHKLTKLGHEVKVITYSDKISNSKFQIPNKSQITNSKFETISISRKQNIIFRYYKYFLAVYKQAKDVDAIIAFDLSSSGIPAVFAAKLRRKKIYVRLGGDFLWEKAFARGWTDQALDEFYKQKKNFQLNFIFSLNKILLGCFDRVVFTSHWQREIYLRHFKLKKEKTIVIKNAFLEQEKNTDFNHDLNTDLIFAGRLIKLKNLERVIEAVSELPGVRLDIYGEGPERDNLQHVIRNYKLEKRIRIFPKLSHDEFMKKLAGSRAALVPSVSEISPITMMECIKLGKPVLVTKNCGYYEDFKDNLMFIDPMDKDDIRKKIEMIYDDEVYEDYLKKIKSISTDRSYKDVADEWAAVF